MSSPSSQKGRQGPRCPGCRQALTLLAAAGTGSSPSIEWWGCTGCGSMRRRSRPPGAKRATTTPMGLGDALLLLRHLHAGAGGIEASRGGRAALARIIIAWLGDDAEVARLPDWAIPHLAWAAATGALPKMAAENE